VVQRVAGAGKRLGVEQRTDGYAPIGAYAALGDGRTTALAAADGSIDFLSLPSLHSPTTFGALLDPDRGGRFVFAPQGRFDADRRYLEGTNVLETTYHTDTGSVRVTDAMTLHAGALLPWVELARRVEGLSGEVPMRWRVEPRFDWGRVAPRLSRRRGVPIAAGPGLQLGVLSWAAGEPELEDGAIAGSFAARGGSRSLLALCCTHEQPLPCPDREDVERRLDETVDAWRRWLAGWGYDGAWREPVARSALALKLLVYAPTGAIAAAPTTSLPERVGGDKNYDYRYVWVRDAALALDALLVLQLPEQVHQSYCSLLELVRTTAPDLRPFYSLDGHPPHRHEELPLRGYRDSRPVRYGNAAADQLQLGCWGDLVETTDLYIAHGNTLDPDTSELVASCVDGACERWADADSGIWELPDRRHYTAAKVGVWMALDRALKLVEEGELPPDRAQRWRDTRTQVQRFVEERCWSDELGAYAEYAGAPGLDAAVLRAARLGWGRVAPERTLRTIDAVRARLDAGGGLLYRTSRNAGEEGAFVACSFWQVEALARVGRVAEAVDVFERLLGHANDVGLFSEEVDPSTGELLGNFPQGLSHLALINAAGALQCGV
jgi:GH15 family glucan-1,4-alpha-glucosidase